MATLNFDFQTPSTRPNPLGIALLLGGIVVLGASLLHMQQANEAHAVRAKEVATLELAQQKKRAPIRAQSSRTPVAGDIAQLAQAKVRSNLDYSWQPAFAALETTQNKKIALISLEASQSKKQMRLVAEARHLADAVEFAHQLNQQNGVKRTALLQHEVQEKNEHRPVRFTLVIEMRP